MARQETQRTEADEYILGTDAQELERLRFQHQVWVKECYALLERGGIGAGNRVLCLLYTSPSPRDS